MTRLTPTVLCAAAIAAVATLAPAQEAMDHSGMAAAGPLAEMMGAMDSMMEVAPRETSGDVDADFLLMMIPHHQSAIAMARVELAHGDDDDTRAMAQAVIDAQEAEIAEMREMLEAMGVAPPGE